MSRLTNQSLLQYRTIELDGEIEVLFDATIAPLNAWWLQSRTDASQRGKTRGREWTGWIWSNIEQELGLFIDSIEIEDLNTDSQTGPNDPDIVKAALRESCL